MKKFISQFIAVRYSETDQMGFVHHSNYVKYFEIARIQWLQAMGVSYAKMERNGIVMPVVAVRTMHKKPLYFGDVFTVSISIDAIPKASMDFEYKIKNQNNEEICLGFTKLAFLDAQKKRPIRCPQILYTAFKNWDDTR